MEITSQLLGRVQDSLLQQEERAINEREKFEQQSAEAEKRMLDAERERDEALTLINSLMRRLSSPEPAAE